MTASWIDGNPPTALILNNPVLDTVTFNGDTSAPSTATGKVYYDTTDNVLFYYDGSEWRRFL